VFEARARRIVVACLALTYVVVQSPTGPELWRESGAAHAQGRESALGHRVHEACFAEVPEHHERATVAHDVELVSASTWVELKLPRAHVAVPGTKALMGQSVRSFAEAVAELHSPREHLRFSALASRAPPRRA